jgi:hypothetical protein
MPKLFKNVSESVDRYHRSAERYEEKWQKDHGEAMQCLELEEQIAFGLTVYNLLNRVDEIWRLAVHKKKIQYKPDFDKAMTKAFRHWLVGSKKLAKIMARFKDYEVTGSAEFRAACREVEGILTDDEKFFVDEKFTNLASAAIKSHRSGETAELGSVTD